MQMIGKTELRSKSNISNEKLIYRMSSIYSNSIRYVHEYSRELIICWAAHSWKHRKAQ